MLEECEFEKSSKQITFASRKRRSQRCEPINPAPPVTTTFFFSKIGRSILIMSNFKCQIKCQMTKVKKINYKFFHLFFKFNLSLEICHLTFSLFQLYHHSHIHAIITTMSPLPIPLVLRQVILTTQFSPTNHP